MFFSFLESQLLNIYQHATGKNPCGPVRFDRGARQPRQQGQQRTAEELGTQLTLPCRRGSKVRKPDSPDIAIGLIKQLLLGQCQSEHLLAIRHTYGGCAPRGALSQPSGLAMAHSQPHDPPWTRPPPSSGAPFPWGSACVSPHSPHAVKPPIILCDLHPLPHPAPPASSSREWGCN